MIYDWYNLFNLTEWLATGLVSRTMTVFLDGIGQVDILITQGNVTAITYGDAFMPVNFADKNPYPYIDGGYAVFKDEDENVYLGIEVPS